MTNPYRWPVARKTARPHPIDAGWRRPVRAKILPRVVRVPGYLPTRPGYSRAALQLFALRQASPRLRAIRLPADCCLTTPATARVQRPALLLQSARWLRKFRWKSLRGPIARADL